MSSQTNEKNLHCARNNRAAFLGGGAALSNPACAHTKELPGMLYVPWGGTHGTLWGRGKSQRHSSSSSAAVQGVARGRTRLSDCTATTVLFFWTPSGARQTPLGAVQGPAHCLTPAGPRSCPMSGCFTAVVLKPFRTETHFSECRSCRDPPEVKSRPEPPSFGRQSLLLSRERSNLSGDYSALFQP